MLKTLAISVLCGGVLLGAGLSTRGLAADRTVPTSLEVLGTMMGVWGPPDSVVARLPQYRGRVIHDYRWTVGRHAIDLREGYAAGKRDSSELRGLIYLDPATQRIEFVAVAGPGPDQGRFFRGEYRLLADGNIERVYDVYYRTAYDTPGDDLGGHRRRYREIYKPVGKDHVEATLDWWFDDQWKPFGPGRYSMARVKP